MPSTLRKLPLLRSMLVPAPEVPIWRVSVPAPPSYVSPDPTSAVLPMMKVSFWLLPTIVSLPVEPLRVMVSAPLVQLVKLQPDRLSEPPVAMLMASALVAPVPLMAAEVEILPAPNWALLKVAVEVPDVLAKAMPSKLRKPLTPSDEAPLRSMFAGAPAAPI